MANEKQNREESAIAFVYTTGRKYGIRGEHTENTVHVFDILTSLVAWHQTQTGTVTLMQIPV